ncbi:hypothetical protein CL619_02875 [archaeon]|nr:hypothetical protein [archaeon]|tara:strand:+ start:5015 stop:5578 length:564 start_codon:yes stop_codon:yes gene_type:complete
MGKDFAYSNTNTGKVMRVRYNGLFDFDTLYAAVIDWGKNYGYKVYENYYKHKVPSPKGAEQQLGINLSKSVNDFVKYNIVISIRTWDMMEVNVDVAGRIKHLTNARVEVKIEHIVDMDWQRKFSIRKNKSKLIGLLSTWYAKMMGPTLEVMYVDGLHYRVINLQSMVKKYFDLQAKAHPYKEYLGES